ncbi:caspase domain-containing protein [Mucor mucedo]|uniref:caspase domain-containing protein n=1 Tax=Mucor mucedo TaxID=29922 RepID=UPI00221EB988|nr:caspase domain-containing protein [Mucor mucedo]KAI7897421.1 caspase domain-containing protein [Mucor mucedo]
MNFPGQGYSTGGYPPQQQAYGSGYPPQQPGYPPQQPGYPPQQAGYPPPQNGYPPQQQGYPPQQSGYPAQGYPPQQPASPYGGYSPQQPPASPYGGYPPQQPQQQTSFDRNIPPAYSPQVQDPMFLPSDPSLAQANYPQPPHSMHNQSPNPVPYGQPQSNPSDYVMHVNPKYRNMPPPNFQLSNCQGRKRALLIGINYFGTSAELKGCINDVENIKQFLVTLYNFNEQDMVILTDNQTNPQNIPTKQNIIRAMQWLVHDSRPNDSFFFHFSGHGGRMKDYDGDEDDGYDETIYPVDHATYGQIVDDMMNDIMVKRLVPGCRLTAIFDSCHSGTALDLPYVYSTQGSIKQQSFLRDAGSSLKNAGKAYISGDPSRAISSVMSLGSRIMSGGNTMKKEKIHQMKGSAADVIMFSGCKDDQTSADASEAGRATGAMSYAITRALRENRNQTYIQLLNSIRAILKQKYNQRPQLSSSHPMDMNLLFVL